ncbi:xanthine dehydrogenase small subunit [Lentimicrobium sp.]|mgnify:CR=1 FL=1|uniref:xanthine dehydrogenase small subunit n=1 Tax=Lentimicrobium sp. TaxID=2034841 RepID=UPI002CD95484|nr:xanthine dehydrogenase small subunit [Lentimicrobium sp.]HPJ62606.1 xanthine dehydrogenase small subunit [Lentimicrobium sp.]HRW69633.1 xanthine dehydrogenase small subunit [Lentimicrobium sp.]
MTATGNKVRFLLNDRLVEVDFSKETALLPSVTVLHYLRSLPGYKGVKEGCAEGDCGACTVVIAEAVEGKLVYKAADSCLLFLPALHNKQLITVEHLAEGDHLHPVQAAMIAHNGSQCGYCTPGIVMSLFGLYKNHSAPDKKVIERALAGNLCRCTGYQSIISAAAEACKPGGNDKFSATAADVAAQLEAMKSDIPLKLLSGKQTYYKAFTLSDALNLRREVPEAQVVAGATDLALRQTKKKELLPVLLDISDVEALRFFAESEDHYIIGTGLTIESLRQTSAGCLPALKNMLDWFGSLQIRNVATLGGNIASASPIGDTLPVLMAYRAQVKLQSAAGERMVPVGDFITGYRKTCLGPGELITAVVIPKPHPGTIVTSYKVSKRRDLDISTVSAGFSLDSRNGTVESIILAYGGMAAQPVRAVNTERFITGKEWSEAVIRQAMKLLEEEFTPLNDVRAGAAYRSLIARNLLLKFFVETEGLAG